MKYIIFRQIYKVAISKVADWKVRISGQKMKKYWKNALNKKKTNFFTNHPLYDDFFLKKSKKSTNKMSIFGVFSISWKHYFVHKSPPIWRFFGSPLGVDLSISIVYTNVYPLYFHCISQYFHSIYTFFSRQQKYIFLWQVVDVFVL